MGERLRDRVALVFGAGSSGPGWGNGKATAVTFAREGARVIAVDVDRAAGEDTLSIIRGEGKACDFMLADVTDAGQVEALVNDVAARYGRIDILHNNVGITAMGGPIEENLESWHRVMDTNLTGMFLTCKHVLPVMLEQKKGAAPSSTSPRWRRSATPATRTAPITPARPASTSSRSGWRCNTRARGYAPMSSCRV